MLGTDFASVPLQVGARPRARQLSIRGRIPLACSTSLQCPVMTLPLPLPGGAQHGSGAGQRADHRSLDPPHPEHAGGIPSLEPRVRCAMRGAHNGDASSRRT
eukprot:2760053-Rhodomonas_salina.3